MFGLQFPTTVPRRVLATLCCLVAILVAPGKCADGDVRLVGSPRSIEGRLEVENQGSWGAVCNNGWDLNDASVVCRQLGYDQGAMLAGDTGSIGLPPGIGPIFITELQCAGTEDRLSDCPGYQIRTNVSRGVCEDATVVCQLPEYLGCFSGADAWIQPISVFVMGMTIDLCVTSCRNFRYQYARLSEGSVCQCSNQSDFGSRVSNDRCSSFTCAGSIRQACGGTLSEGIYTYYPTSLGSGTGTYTGGSGIISSPNFPGFYKPGVDGHWRIMFSSSRTVRFSFDFIDLYSADSIEIMSSARVVRIGNGATTLEYTLTGDQFEVKLLVDANSEESNAGFLLRYFDLNVDPLVPTTKALSSTEQSGGGTSPQDCLNIGSLLTLDNPGMTIQPGFSLFYNQTFKCNALLTSLTLDVRLTQSFAVTLWREGEGGAVRPLSSITLNITDGDANNQITFDTDSLGDSLRFRDGDWLSLDMAQPAFFSTANIGTDTPFILLNRTGIDSLPISEFERRLGGTSLMNGSSVALSVEIKFRELQTCDAESVPHATLESEYDPILEGDTVNVVCDRYYRLTNATSDSAVCQMGGMRDRTFNCSRTCSEYTGPSAETLRMGVPSDESGAVLLQVGMPFTCRGSVTSVTYYDEPRKFFQLSTWELNSTSSSYEMYDIANITVRSNSNNVTLLENVLLSKELRFREGQILGISYMMGNSLRYPDNSLGVDLSEYLIWNFTADSILVVANGMPLQRLPSLRLQLKSAKKCFLEGILSEGSVNSSNEDVMGYIPDGFIQAGDTVTFTCRTGYQSQRDELFCQDDGTFEFTPVCIAVDPGISPSLLWVVLWMVIVIVAVGFIGVACIAFYYLCTIPEPSRQVDPVEEYILNRNRRNSDDIPDSLPGESDTSEDYPVGNEYTSAPEKDEVAIPVPYDPNSDTFDSSMPPPRSVSFSDDPVRGQPQVDDGGGSPVPEIAYSVDEFPSLAEDPPPPPPGLPPPPPPEDSPTPTVDSPSPPPPPESPPPMDDGIPLIPIQTGELDVPPPPAE